MKVSVCPCYASDIDKMCIASNGGCVCAVSESFIRRVLLLFV